MDLIQDIENSSKSSLSVKPGTNDDRQPNGGSPVAQVDGAAFCRRDGSGFESRRGGRRQQLSLRFNGQAGRSISASMDASKSRSSSNGMVFSMLSAHATGGLGRQRRKFVVPDTRLLILHRRRPVMPFASSPIASMVSRARERNQSQPRRSAPQYAVYRVNGVSHTPIRGFNSRVGLQTQPIYGSSGPRLLSDISPIFFAPPTAVRVSMTAAMLCPTLSAAASISRSPRCA